jgi:hypothetical protein
MQDNKNPPKHQRRQEWTWKVRMSKIGRKVKPSGYGERHGTGKILQYNCSLLGQFTSGNVELCDNSKVRSDQM